MTDMGTAVFRAVGDFSSVTKGAAGAATALTGMETAAGRAGTASDVAAATAGSRWQKTAKKMGGLGKSMSMGITLPMTLIGVAAARTFTQFDTSITKAGANANATGAELEALRAKAMKMGADTAFSATDAADALFELSAAGLTLDESMQAVDATLLLASATGSDLVGSTTLVAQSLNAFSLEADQAARVADVFTMAANSSALQVEDLQLAIGQVGEVGSRFGQSLEGVVAVLSAMRNQGVPAASAGVAIRQALTSLSAPTDKARAGLKALGIETRNAKGDMKQFPELLASFEKGLDLTNPKLLKQADAAGLSAKAYKDLVMKQTFGVEGAKAFALSMNNVYENTGKTAQEQAQLATITKVMGQAYVDAHTRAGKFVTTGAESIKVLRLLNKNSGGTAKAFDDIMKETTARKFEALMGSIQSVAISFGTALKPVMGVLAEFFTMIANWVTNLAEANPALAGIVAGLAALLVVAGPMLIIVSKLIQAFQIVKTALMAVTAAQWLFNGALLANPITWIIIAVIALIAAIWLIVANWDKISAWLAKAWEWLKGVWSKVWDAILNAFKAVWEAIKNAGKAVWDWILNAIKWYLNLYLTIWTTAWNALKAAAVAVWNAIKTFLAWNWNLIKSVFTRTWNAIKAAASAVWNAIKSFVQAGINFVRNVITNGINAARTIWHNAWTAIGNVVSSIFNGVKNVVGAVVGWIQDKFSVISGIAEKIGGIVSGIGGAIGGAVNFVTGNANRGGLIPGGGPDKDSVLYRLTPGEYVVRRKAVKAYGAAKLAQINAMGSGSAARRASGQETTYTEDDLVRVSAAAGEAAGKDAANAGTSAQSGMGKNPTNKALAKAIAAYDASRGQFGSIGSDVLMNPDGTFIGTGKPKPKPGGAGGGSSSGGGGGRAQSAAAQAAAARQAVLNVPYAYNDQNRPHATDYPYAYSGDRPPPGQPHRPGTADAYARRAEAARVAAQQTPYAYGRGDGLPKAYNQGHSALYNSQVPQTRANVNVVVNNPAPEPASTSLTRSVQRVAFLGLVG